MDLQNYTLWEISSVIFPKSKTTCQLQCIPGTKIMRILKFIWEMQLVEWSGLGVSLVLLLGEKLLSINDDLAIQSRWYHYLKMCQITLITMKGSVSYITWERGHLPPEKTDACDFLLVTKRLRHAEVARHSDHVTRPFLFLSFFLHRKWWRSLLSRSLQWFVSPNSKETEYLILETNKMQLTNGFFCPFTEIRPLQAPSPPFVPSFLPFSLLSFLKAWQQTTFKVLFLKDWKGKIFLMQKATVLNLGWQEYRGAGFICLRRSHKIQFLTWQLWPSRKKTILPLILFPPLIISWQFVWGKGIMEPQLNPWKALSL